MFRLEVPDNSILKSMECEEVTKTVQKGSVKLEELENGYFRESYTDEEGLEHIKVFRNYEITGSLEVWDIISEQSDSFPLELFTEKIMY